MLAVVADRVMMVRGVGVMDVGVFFSLSLFLSLSISISFVERVGSVGCGRVCKTKSG